MYCTFVSWNIFLLVVAPEEVAKIQLELDYVKQAHDEAHAMIKVAEGEFKNYKDKIYELQADIGFKS